MNILFFLEPSIEQNNPLFRYATLRNSILPQAKFLKHHHLMLLSNTFVMEEATKNRLTRHFNQLIAVNPLEWSQGESSISRSLRLQQHSLPQDGLTHLRHLLNNAGMTEPDLIIVWETPADFLTEIYPNAKIIYQMPGFFSRPPYASLVSFDTGLLDSSTIQNTDGVNQTELQTLRTLRQTDKDFLLKHSPLRDVVLQARQQFKRIVLFPLQIDDYFMITYPADGRHQLQVLMDTLVQLPSDIGVLVTNYKSKDIQSSVLDKHTVEFLRYKFTNFLYFEATDGVPYCSQFLTPEIDGVISISSSIALQAAYYQKPMFAIGKTHLTPFASSQNLDEFVNQVRQNKIINRDTLILSTIKHQHLSSHFIQSEAYSDWLVHFSKTGKFLPQAENITEILKSQRRESTLLKEIGYYSNAKANFNYSPELIEAVQKHDIISFDIFDTLLMRPFASPADLFHFMNDEVCCITGNPALDFYTERRSAEQAAFQSAIERGEGETTIAEIYEKFAENVNVSHDVAKQIMLLEMEIEQALLYPRQTAKAAFDMANTLGKRIFIISDMYLPEQFLSELLAKNGYSGYEKLFVSSTYKAKKHNGKLFQAMLAELKVTPGSILHIGDNSKADVEQAKKHGLTAFHLPKAFEQFKNTSAYIRPWQRDESNHNLHFKMQLAIVGQHFSDNPLLPFPKGTVFKGNAYDLGYYGFGFLLMGFTKWLIERAISDGIDTLYFLARDGKIMKEAYDTIAPLYPEAPKSIYMLCSRRAVNLAKVENLEGLMDLLKVDIAHRMSLGALLESRFGATFNDVPQETLQTHGFSWQTKLVKTDLPRLMKLFADLQEVLLPIALDERENYLAYLDQIRLFAKGKHAIVDIGYAGTMQESLYQLSGNQKKLGGYYLMTFRKALDRLSKNRLSSSAYLAEFVDRHDTYHPFCRHVPLYESLFSSEDTSFIKMVKSWDGKLQPIFMDHAESEAQREKFVQILHKGALALIRENVVILGGYFKELDLEPNKSLRLLAQLFREPHPRDAKLFLNLAFEDAYGGRGITYIANPNLDGGIWREGVEVLRKDATANSGKKIPVSENKPKPSEKEVASVNSDNSPLSFKQKVIQETMLFMLNERKQNKLLNNPKLFFYDAKNPLVKAIGKSYLKKK